MEEGKMKKLVCFTVAMVFALAIPMMAIADVTSDDGSATALKGGVAVAVDDISVQGNALAKGNAATNGGEIDNSKDIDVNKNTAEKGSNLALQGGEIDNSKEITVNKVEAEKGSTVATQGGRIDNSVDNRSNYDNDYIVDNAVLKNVNIHPDEEFKTKITFIKTQKAEVNGSFHDYNGVSNTNSAAGNMNNQTAYTSVSIGSIGNGGGSSHR
jgi:hypothetical protein